MLSYQGMIDRPPHCSDWPLGISSHSLNAGLDYFKTL